MLEKVKEAFSQFGYLSPTDLLQIAALARLDTLKKGEFLFRSGDVYAESVVVLSGLLRHYVIDPNGSEKTMRFVPERSMTASLDYMVWEQSAVENVVALENCVLLKFDLRKVEKLVDGNVRLMKVQLKEIKNALASSVEQTKFLTVMTPEERYEAFKVQYPDLEQRIRQKYLASYIGVTPESLSRIRARMSKANQ